MVAADDANQLARVEQGAGRGLDVAVHVGAGLVHHREGDRRLVAALERPDGLEGRDAGPLVAHQDYRILRHEGDAGAVRRAEGRVLEIKLVARPDDGCRRSAARGG